MAYICKKHALKLPSFASVLAVTLCLFSCSAQVNSIQSVSASVIFDYSDLNSPPSVSLSVFAQPAYDAQRVASVSIASIETGWEWKSDRPVVLPSKRDSGWAGFLNCVPESGKELPQGSYMFFCTDLAFDSSDTAFSVSYPRELLTLNQKDAVDFVTSRGGFVYNTALYDSDGILLYYGEQDADRNRYPTARSKRTFLVSQGLNIICMLSKEKI